jgi:dihydroorotate dehydrogenase
VSSVGNRLGIPPIPDIENPEISSQRLQEDPSITCLSGQWLKPLAIRDVYEIRKVNGPLLAIFVYGGMSHWQDYVEMAMIGTMMMMTTMTMMIVHR